MTPLESYQKKLDAGDIRQNEQQRKVMETFEKIYDNLVKHHDSLKGKLYQKFKMKQAIKGLYLYGCVGVGKTRMLDIFYECLPIGKIRLHLHAFMQKIHQSLHQTQGLKNPLQHIAKNIAKEAYVLCFDEFFISNITDAMILGELLKALFKEGICFVTTSNSAPDDLYKNGLQRERFLPAIEIIKHNVSVIHLRTDIDYRRQFTKTVMIYFTPLNSEAEKNMEHAFQYYSDSDTQKNTTTNTIDVLGRPINIIKQASNTIWFAFDKICKRPRSQNDYLELVKHYDTFLVSHVPILDQISDDQVLSFIHFVDVLYDKKKRLVISAAAPPTQLYHSKRYQMAFQRTESRLIEMQTDHYFSYQ